MEHRFDQTFRRAYPRLVGLAWRVLRDRAAAEDVAQETLARLADAALLDRPDGEVDAWLTRVCINRASNALRARVRAVDREDRAGRREPPPDGQDPAVAVVDGEDRDAVRSALAALPERQRAVRAPRRARRRRPRAARAAGPDRSARP